MEGSVKKVATTFQQIRKGFSIAFRADIYALVPCDVWRDIVKNIDIRCVNKLAQTCTKFNKLVNYERATDIRYALAYKRERQLDVTIKYFELNQDDPLAMYHLGHIYWALICDDEHNPLKEKAFTCFKKAADCGYEPAEAVVVFFRKFYYGSSEKLTKHFSNNFAYAFTLWHDLDGIHGKDTNVTFKYFEASAIHDNDEYAQFILAQLYRSGHGISRDIDMAIYWTMKSVEQGYIRAPKQLKQLMKYKIK